ncbi:hypothetical protein, variant 1 [Aphanomyces invadans]|uniref:DDHD domain-containing protein n=1 Tax=Aphanomyces invadans TaxID=157072 RepID=A0A024UIW9_9STRA|nr:hypothetical protein, variant 1 [Aphanomyces invadans]ETW06371.1 hypothetical protein, variant 1 [Aphanomyces invadans]|eukprot:XP_008864446.1 hypothetical protein, variant 1 [Aphanomyces invadans]
MAPTVVEENATKVVPWAYMRKGEWFIFSKEDCEKLEGCRDFIPVVVDQGRLEVTVHERTVSAVFWKEGPYPVIRTEWLFESSGGKFFPIPEDEATEINRYWASLPKDTAHYFSLPVEDHMTAHEIKFGPSKSPTEQKISELFLKCAHTRSRRCKAIHHGYPGWTSAPVPGSIKSPSSASTDHSRSSTSTDTRREVNHVVFVVHGIGETYCKKRQADGTIVDYCYAMRQSTESILTSHFPTVAAGIEYLPVDWSDVMRDMGDDLHAMLHRISFEAMPFVREICNELLSDILMYMERKQKVLAFVATYMNSIYALYKHRHPSFQGKVSILGHSLGSVITYDLLSAQHATHGDATLHLDFHPDAYFAFGAPIGLFLALRGRGHGDTLALPTVSRMYNINHPSDPISYRLEPLLYAKAKVLPPVRLNTFSGWKRIHHAVQDIVESLESSQKKLAKDIGTAFNNLGNMLKPKPLDNTVDGGEDSAGNDAPTDENVHLEAMLARLNPRTKRLDFVLPESEIEALTPLAALTAHTGWWMKLTAATL